MVPPEPTFGFVTSVRPWARAWARHVADHGPGRVVDHIAEPKCLWDSPYAVLVADADSELLDAAVVAEAHRRGRAVVTVWDPTDPRTKELGVEAGADLVVEGDAGAEEFLGRAVGLVGLWGAPAPAATPRSLAPSRSKAPRARAAPAPTPQRRRSSARGGMVAAVAGPAGDEVSEVAVELARALAWRRRVAVVDADDVAPLLAQRLGLPVLPNLRIAVDALRHTRRRVADALLVAPGGGFWVLPGLADAAQWSDITPDEVAEVVEALATEVDVVLVQAGPLAEDLACRGGPDRFGITRAMLAGADLIVGVGLASPTGLARLIAWAVEVRALAPATPLHLAVCRAPRGGFRRAEVSERLGTDLAPASVSLLPSDPRTERANWDGVLARPGPFSRAVASLAGTAFGVRAPHRPLASLLGGRVASPSAAEVLFEAVRTGVADERVDPDVNAGRVRQIAEAVVGQHGREAAVGAATPLHNPTEMVERLVRMVCSWGPLTEAIDNPATEEVLIEGDLAFSVADGRVRGLVEPTTEALNRHVVDQLLADTAVSLDPSHPIVDGVQVLGGRGRLAAAVPPVSPHLSACLRLWRQRRVPMADQVAADTISGPAANFLTLVAWALGSVVVSGAPGAGKTTFLSSLLGLVRDNHCLRVVEEYRELYVPKAFGAAYQCRPPDAAGAGEKTLRDLIKFALRMRADMLCVGEVRSAESFELTRATHAGTGFCCTLHAHSALDALEVLVMTALAAGEAVDERYVRRTFAHGIDVVVHLERDDPNLVAEGDPYRRQVTEVRALAPQLEGDAFSAWPIFERKGGLGSPLAWTGEMPATALVDRLERLLPPRRRLKAVLEGRAGLR